MTEAEGLTGGVIEGVVVIPVGGGVEVAPELLPVATGAEGFVNATDESSSLLMGVRLVEGFVQSVACGTPAEFPVPGPTPLTGGRIAAVGLDTEPGCPPEEPAPIAPIVGLLVVELIEEPGDAAVETSGACGLNASEASGGFT